METSNNPVKLNLPEYSFRLKKVDGKVYIFDEVRKKFIVRTPEEWVRQHFIQFLIKEKKYSPTLMAIEKKVMVNSQPQRFDLLIYNRKGAPHVVAEFKAPNVRISQQAFDQVVRYNMKLRVKYIIISNGMEHFICEVDYEKNSYSFLKEIPVFGI